MYTALNDYFLRVVAYIIGRFDLLKPVGHFWAGTLVWVIYLGHLLVSLTDVEGGAVATHLQCIVVVHLRLKIIALKEDTCILQLDYFIQADRFSVHEMI